MTSQPDSLSLVAPLGFVLAGLAFGLIVEYLLLDRIAASLERRGHAIAARLLVSLRTAFPLWTTALGARLGTDAYPLAAHERILLQEILGLVMLFATALVAARVATRLLSRYLRQHVETLATASLFSSLIGIAIWSVALLVALQLLGIAVGPVLAALGVGGLAVALALQPTLQNLFAGLQIIASRQIKIGDYVQLEAGKEGYVSDISWRTTTIRDLANHIIVVPNAILAQSSFTNFAFPEQSSLVVAVLLGYDADLALAERVTLEVARETLMQCGAPLEGFEPYLRFTEIGNENLKLAVYLRARASIEPSQIRSQFLKALLTRYRSEGIRSPFPARTAETAQAPAQSP
jgi:small-conductance mechanosensitive channel